MNSDIGTNGPSRIVRPSGGLANRTERLVGLQWGRAIAAVAVLVTHAIAYPYPTAPEAAHLLGRFGVTLFFVISGYIMVATTGPGSFEPAKFMRNRIVRIVPLYYIANVIAAGAVLLVPAAFKRMTFDGEHVLLSLLFIPAYKPDGSGLIEPFIKLGWTLNYEMFFYLVFALLSAFDAWMRAILLSIIFGGLILAGQMFAFQSPILAVYTGIDTLAFAAGVWAAVLSTSYDWRPSTRLSATAVAAALVLLAAMAIRYGAIRHAPATQVGFVIVCAVLITVLARGVPSRFDGSLRWLTTIGDASYSIYLFHMFAVGFVTVVGLRYFGLTSPWPVMAMAAVVGLGASLAVYRVIEAPIIRYFKPVRATPGPSRRRPADEPYRDAAGGWGALSTGSMAPVRAVPAGETETVLHRRVAAASDQTEIGSV